MDHWIEVAIDTNPAGLDLVGSVLTGLDIAGFVIEDETDFLTFLEENKDTWDYVDEGLMASKKGVSRVKFYLTEDEAGRETLKTVRRAMERLAAETEEGARGSLRITLRDVKNEDWEHNWKAYYKPFPVGTSLYIIPEWERDMTPPPGRIPLYLNPGLIFGTGEHTSTRMCLEMMEPMLRKGDDVLDLGSGSGILSVASLKLGAKFAAACDIDPKAEKVALANGARNDIAPGRYQVETGNVLEDPSLADLLAGRAYQVVFSNIVADVIIALAPRIHRFLAPGGVWIGSGVIDSRKEDVKAALLENGFSLSRVREEGGWVCFAAGLTEGRGDT
jgi:ribosomal protein L11 methyltransferase